ncbi:MAG TPA: hypothetical protein PKH22_10600 [Leptospiraceae bacterium]|nr:hypothetical protein [Leptospiraceae bacterium]
MRKKLALVISISLFLNLSISAKEVPSSGEMIAEILVRPLGLVGLATGASLFIVTLPFGVLNRISTGSWETVTNSGKRLVIAPALFTFARGVGVYPGHMEEIELVKE